MSDTRPLSEREFAVLERFLEGDDATSIALRAQLPFARHAGVWFEGSQSFDIVFEVDVAPAPITVTQPFGANLHVMYGDEYIGAPFLWVNERGLLDSFQYLWVSVDAPERLPEPSEILTVEQSTARGVVHAPDSQDPRRHWSRNSRR